MKPWLLRFRPPLHIVVLLFMLTCSLASLGFKVFMVDPWKVQTYTEAQARIAGTQAVRLAFILGSHSPVRDRALESQILAYQSQSLIRWAAACDPDGKIFRCTRKEWEGHMLSEVAPSAAGKLLTQVATTRKLDTVLHEGDGIMAAQAVPNDKEKPLQYVAILERDLQKGLHGQARAAWRETVMTAGMMLGYSLLLWLFIFVFFRWRMRDVFRQSDIASKYAPQGGDDSVPLSGDEFTEIASVFGKAEMLLKDIAESLNESIWIITPDMRTIYLSPAFETIHGHKREESYVSPPTMPDYILKEYHDQVRAAFGAVVQGADSLHLEYRIRRGDGEIRWLEVRGGAVRENGELQRIVGISRDITEQKTLQEELVSVSEQERHSLGHDLHDDACQRLAASKMKSETLANLLKKDDSPHLKLAKELVVQISGTAALLRNIARGLAPVEVSGDGLMLALEKLVLMQEAIHEVPCFFHADTPVLVGNEIVATHLYRIVQELMTNAARHAKPERIDVRVTVVADQVRITVTNDGGPFREPFAGHHGMGLKIIRYRASAIHAAITITPRHDGVEGTLAEVTISEEICLAGTFDGNASPMKPQDFTMIQ